MQDQVRQIEEFPDYYASFDGQIISSHRSAPLTQTLLAYGAPAVWLTRDGRRHCRAVALLIARAWLPDPIRYDFTTPIHLDGDRQNCHAKNLAWRPRWFAVNYHKEKLAVPFSNWRRPIEIIETREIFATPKECSLKYGILEHQIWTAIVNDSETFPHRFHFRYVL